MSVQEPYYAGVTRDIFKTKYTECQTKYNALKEEIKDLKQKQKEVNKLETDNTKFKEIVEEFQKENKDFLRGAESSFSTLRNQINWVQESNSSLTKYQVVYDNLSNLEQNGFGPGLKVIQFAIEYLAHMLILNSNANNNLHARILMLNKYTEFFIDTSYIELQRDLANVNTNSFTNSIRVADYLLTNITGLQDEITIMRNKTINLQKYSWIKKSAAYQILETQLKEAAESNVALFQFLNTFLFNTIDDFSKNDDKFEIFLNNQIGLMEKIINDNSKITGFRKKLDNSIEKGINIIDYLYGELAACIGIRDDAWARLRSYTSFESILTELSTKIADKSVSFQLNEINKAELLIINKYYQINELFFRGIAAKITPFNNYIKLDNYNKWVNVNTDKNLEKEYIIGLEIFQYLVDQLGIVQRLNLNFDTTLTTKPFFQSFEYKYETPTEVNGAEELDRKTTWLIKVAEEIEKQNRDSIEATYNNLLRIQEYDIDKEKNTVTWRDPRPDTRNGYDYANEILSYVVNHFVSVLREEKIIKDACLLKLNQLPAFSLLKMTKLSNIQKIITFVERNDVATHVKIKETLQFFFDIILQRAQEEETVKRNILMLVKTNTFFFPETDISEIQVIANELNTSDTPNVLISTQYDIIVDLFKKFQPLLRFLNENELAKDEPSIQKKIDAVKKNISALKKSEKDIKSFLKSMQAGILLNEKMYENKKDSVIKKISFDLDADDLNKISKALQKETYTNEEYSDLGAKIIKHQTEFLKVKMENEFLKKQIETIKKDFFTETEKDYDTNYKNTPVELQRQIIEKNNAITKMKAYLETFQNEIQSS